nr:hypothetical protein [Tanacetum cinerariifolium]
MSESSRIYKGKGIMTDMNARFKIDISYSQAWRAKCYALQLLRGTPEESFAELPLYCHNLKLKNQGTITHIETDDEDRFEIFFSCRRCCDGAHLKGEFLGTMYLAVAMDGNNQILPLAYGVGKSETFRSWDCIANKLDMIGLEKWARVHFPDIRYNYMTSNSVESVNALSRRSQKLPIFMMIDWFIKSFATVAKLAQRIAKSATWTVRPAANYLYNVVDYYKNATVDLNSRTCSCGQWQLSGLPCGHLIAVMRHLRQSSANQFPFSCFKTSVWRASYNEVIFDVGHPSEWDQPDGLIIVLPPVMDKRQPGRPRNRDRLRSKGEQITPKSCGHNGEMSTQEYVRKIIEEASEDDHFTRGPWLSAVQYLATEGSIATGCFGDMKTFIRNGKLEKVVAVIK